MKKENSFQYGGQAVIEGVMMRGQETVAVAVRNNKGKIVVKEDAIGSVTKKYPILKTPFIRGIIGLCESMGVGVKALMFSADQYMEDETESSMTWWETTLMFTVAIGMTIFLFVVLPLITRTLLNRFFPGYVLGNVFESVMRMLVLFLYIVSISFMKDIRRVFAYHGAEHKTINTYEANEELTVENARKHTTFHPRCGTSFLFFVVIVSAVMFSFLKYENVWDRLLSRIVLLPLVAGVSYEIIKFTGRHQDFWLWRWLSAPGKWLQMLTTRQPDDSQLEVAIVSLQTVLRSEGKLPPLGTDFSEIETAKTVETTETTETTETNE